MSASEQRGCPGGLVAVFTVLALSIGAVGGALAVHVRPISNASKAEVIVDFLLDCDQKESLNGEELRSQSRWTEKVSRQLELVASERELTPYEADELETAQKRLIGLTGEIESHENVTSFIRGKINFLVDFHFNSTFPEAATLLAKSWERAEDQKRVEMGQIARAEFEREKAAKEQALGEEGERKDSAQEGELGGEVNQIQQQTSPVQVQGSVKE